MILPCRNLMHYVGMCASVSSLSRKDIWMQILVRIFEWKTIDHIELVFVYIRIFMLFTIRPYDHV